MDLHLRGRCALITGASKGIGAAVAETLAEEGCHLHLAARNTAAMDELAGRLRDRHRVCVAVHSVDLRDGDSLRQLAETAKEIDILVNNAGDIPSGTLDSIDEATWRHAWDLKVFGYINLTRLAYARMKARGGGAIVNIIGAAGERFEANYIVGSAGNAALMAFTRALGGTSLKDEIRVVGINPGPVATDRIIALTKRRAQALLGDEKRAAEIMQSFPRGRAAHPREIADMAAFLASDRSGYTSGVIVTIDGGLCAGSHT